MVEQIFHDVRCGSPASPSTASIVLSLVADGIRKVPRAQGDVGVRSSDARPAHHTLDLSVLHVPGPDGNETIIESDAGDVTRVLAVVGDLDCNCGANFAMSVRDVSGAFGLKLLQGRRARVGDLSDHTRKVATVCWVCVLGDIRDVP